MTSLPDPEQGVIEEARRRQRRRHRGIAAVALLVLGGALAGLITSAGGGQDARAPFRVGAREIAPVAWSKTPAQAVGTVKLSPIFARGWVGWEVWTSEGGTAPFLPRYSNPLFDVELGTKDHPDAVVAFTNPYVAAVSVGGGKPVLTHPTTMPYGFRVAVVPVGHRISLIGGSPSDERLLKAMRAYDAEGQRLLKSREFVNQGPVQYWQRPQRPPPGRCELSATGLKGVRFARGHVALRVWPHAGVVGRAFQSCADTTYLLNNASVLDGELTAAILLDAAHPGRTAGAIAGYETARRRPRRLRSLRARTWWTGREAPPERVARRRRRGRIRPAPGSVAAHARLDPALGLKVLPNLGA